MSEKAGASGLDSLDTPVEERCGCAGDEMHECGPGSAEGPLSNESTH